MNILIFMPKNVIRKFYCSFKAIEKFFKEYVQYHFLLINLRKGAYSK